MYRLKNRRFALNAASLFVPAACLLLGLAATSAARAEYAETTLHMFGSTADDGQMPSFSGFAQTSDGTIWGITSEGGSADEGTVFKYTATGQYNVVHNFGDGTVPNDGAYPGAALTVGPDGNLYGTTGGGGTTDNGTVFKITPAGAVTILHSFLGVDAGDGTEPATAVTFGHDGKLYGTTAGELDPDSSSTANGTIFSMKPDGTNYLVQFSFNTANEDIYGAVPETNLTPAGGTSNVLYGGNTSYGASKEQNGGTLFAFTPGTATNGGKLKVLHSFRDGSVANDGTVPFTGRLTITPSGDILGITLGGGQYAGGTIFMCKPDGSSYLVAHSFSSTVTDGDSPSGGLTLGSDGNYYGVCMNGGTGKHFDGLVYRANLKKSGGVGYVIVYDFTGQPETGTDPQSRLFEDSDGNLLGTTNSTVSSNGDPSGPGTFFKLLAGLPNPVAISALTVSPATVVGGQMNSTGTVTLNRPAGSNGAVVELVVDQNANGAASTPSSITIPAGHETGTFTITTKAVGSPVKAEISAGYNDSQGNAPLTINP